MASRPSSLRVLLATFGSLGDLHPYIAVARALHSRGHRPLIATTDLHRQAVSRKASTSRRCGPPRPFRKVSVEGLERELRALLDNAAHAQQAASTAAQVRTEDGGAQAAQCIERLVASSGR